MKLKFLILFVMVVPASVISGKRLHVLPSAGNAEFSEHTLKWPDTMQEFRLTGG